MARQRSTKAHEKVLHAALCLFGERGIEATSMDAIARVSGVSKATIYNHWQNKEALLLDVMMQVNGLNQQPDEVDTGSMERDLAIVLSRRPPGEFEEARTRMMPSLLAYSAVHTEFGQAWRHRVMEPPRQSLKRILKREMERGVLDANVDMDVAMALLLGPVFYNHIFVKGPKEKKREIGAETAEAFVRAFAVPAATRRKGS